MNNEKSIGFMKYAVLMFFVAALSSCGGSSSSDDEEEEAKAGIWNEMTWDKDKWQ